MKTVKEKLQAHIETQPVHRILTPATFEGLGSRSAVNRALTELVREGLLERVFRGWYVKRVLAKTVLLKPGTRIGPGTYEIIQGIEELTGEVIVDNPWLSLNRLRLSTGVPMREIFLTSGRPRILRDSLRGGRIEIRRAEAWQIAAGKSLAGDAARALGTLRHPEDFDEALQRLHRDFSAEDWEQLLALIPVLPAPLRARMEKARGL